MKAFAIIFLIFSLLLSCGESSEELQAENVSQNSSAIFGDKSYSFPTLTTSAKEEVMRWSIMEDFLYEAINVNGSNFEELRNRSERLDQNIDSVYSNIPEILNTNSITSRLNVIKTRTELLYQVSHQSKIDSLAIQKNIYELNVGVTNLITQLNEKFQKDKIDYQRKDAEDAELKKQKRFQDSIYTLELQDQKN